MLLLFVQDTDEYVRRRALMALADIGSAQVEDLAEAMWPTDDEHVRMSALYARWKVGSTRLHDYLTEAKTDANMYLAQYARRVRAGDAI
ncbi:MAG TPA: HEAT repeat domain-containing protein [Ktedonobacterales bacterium]|nr:HEAT repeat domain-containing protein [Ktedonobacterales bacterium]